MIMGIKRKLIISLIVFFTIPMLGIGIILYFQIQESLNKNLLQDIAAYVEGQRSDIQGIVEDTVDEAKIIARTSALEGYVRAQAAGGADPWIGASSGFWIAQFQSLLKSVAAVYPYFYKLRYIDARGDEIVYLVSEDGKRMYFRPLDTKDNKSGRYFFKEGMRKNKDQAYVSPLDLEIDYGKLELPHKPVVRVAVPVFDALDGLKNGLILINVRMGPFINSLKQPSIGHRIIVNEQGYYLDSPDHRKEYAFQLGHNFNAFTDIAGLARSSVSASEGIVHDRASAQWGVWKKLYYNPGDTRHFWVIADVFAQEDMDRVLSGFRYKFLFFLIFFVIIVFVFVGWIAEIFTKPILKLTRFVDKMGKGSLNTDALTETIVSKGFFKDPKEIVDLRQGIHSMLTRIKESMISIEMLEASNEKALLAVKAKSNFLANMSHEIRTPMNAILGFSYLLNNTMLNTKQKGYLDLVINSGQLLVGVIDDILDVSKLESGKIHFEQMDCDLKKIIFDVMGMIVTRMKSKPFDTYVDIKEDVPWGITTDPLRLKQVLVNLLGNAVKFTAHGDVGIIVEKINASEDSVELKFTIKDTGIGIPKDKQAHLFQPFSQADDSTTRLYGGTGLGLMISKSIIEGLGGKIWFESQEGKGSSFYFVINVKKASKQPVAAQGALEDARFNNQTVFIVDDNLMSQKILSHCCAALHLSILGCSSSPHEALHQLDKIWSTQGVVPAIILSDIMMEGMSGLDMVALLKSKERFKNTCFIAVTASLNAENEFDPAQKVFNAYVTKPVSMEVLTHALNGCLNASVANTAQVLDYSCQGVRVLVAEDIVTNQILIQEYLESLGCLPVIVNNGKAALERLKVGNDFDLCLMDLQMPVLGGIDTVKIIRQEMRLDLPVVALSAAVLQKDQEEAFAAGMTDFLMKPIDVARLKETILKYKRG